MYLDKEKFKKDVLESLEKGYLTDEAAKGMLLIAKHLTTKFTYKNPMDRDDCIGAAMLEVCKYWNRYNPKESPYPFSFFTTMITNGLAKGWGKINPLSQSILLRMKE
jgi:DNA-directed RNA polymerase specialized sigma subunit